MLSYILKRLLIFLPTLFLVSIFIFLLSKQNPDDVIETKLALQGIEAHADSFQEEYDALYKREYNDLPLFYFSILSSFRSPLRGKVLSKSEKKFIDILLSENYTCESSLSLLEKLKNCPEVKTRELIIVNSFEQITSRIDAIDHCENEFENWKNSLRTITFHYPKFYWNGFKNQYHHWIADILSFEYGNSLLDGRPVKTKVFYALQWTIILIMINILIALVIAFPLGILFSLNEDSTWYKAFNNALLLIFAIPKFWLATMLILFFTTAEYGAWTNIFPSVGFWRADASQTVAEIMFSNVDQLILPLIILILPDVAYLIRVINAGITEEKSKMYVLTAFSKGLTKKQVTTKHILPNALTPLITLISGVIPSAITGSLIIEVIFNIPGMGRLLYTSIKNSDWTVVYPIVFLSCIFALIAFLIADLLIAYLNPKVTLE